MGKKRIPEEYRSSMTYEPTVKAMVVEQSESGLLLSEVVMTDVMTSTMNGKPHYIRNFSIE